MNVLRYCKNGRRLDGKHTMALSTNGSGRLLGYARVSTDDQGTDPQLDELRAAGCITVHEEHASGADRSRPVLARLLRDIRPSETPVVVRPGAHTSAACAIRSTRRRRRACFRSRCSALSRSSSGR